MAGAQAQVLLAAQMSLWARVREVSFQELDSAIWKDRRLVKVWCMRRTMYLVPSEELAIFVRGSARRAEREIRWVQSRGMSEQKLDKVLKEVLELLDKPRTKGELAELLSKRLGYKLRFKLGGGWGSRSKVPWLKVENLDFPVGYLLHLVGARGAVCSGPSKGNESTFVRADKWIHNWKDMPVEKAEKKLFLKYLKAFGPATVLDYALWTGMLVSDAKEIWSREADTIAQVEVEGSKSAILKSDLSELEEAKLERPNVRLLPYFDSFGLGHKSHRNIVDEVNRKKVYRSQGWVSPVLLVNGRALGVWSHTRNSHKNTLEVRIAPFSSLSSLVSLQIREEASALGRFLGCPSVKTVIG
jgi:Winged helix DNA-binding domain